MPFVIVGLALLALGLLAGDASASEEMLPATGDAGGGAPADASGGGDNSAGGASSPPEPDPDDVGALARVLVSELADGTPEEWTGIGEVVRNKAARKGKSIAETIAPQGFGEQGTGGRLYSSAHAATDASTAFARALLEQPVTSTTDGATAWFEPVEQDKLKALGDDYRAAQAAGDAALEQRYFRFRLYKKSADDVRADWGKTMDQTATIGRLEFWRDR